VEDVVDGLKVKRSAGQDRSFINVLSITYNSKLESDARKVVDAVIAAYAQYLEETRHEHSTEVLSLITKAHDEILDKLHEKEREYLAFRQTAPLQWRSPVGANSDGQGTTTNVHQERVLAIEEQRKLNLLRQAELRSRMAALDAGLKANEPRESLELLVRRFMNADGPSARDVQEQRELAAFEAKLLPMLLEEERLARDFGEDWPELVSVRKSIQSTIDFYAQHGVQLPNDKDANGKPVRRNGADFIAVYIDSLRQQINELKNRNVELSKDFEEELIKAKDLAQFQAKDQTMNAEITQIRKLWEQLTTQVNQVDIEKDSSGYSLKQIAPVKSMVSLKRLLKIFGAGAIFGLGCVAVWAFLREWRDTTLKTALDVQHCLRLPMLGGVRKFSARHDSAANDSGRLHPTIRYWHAPTSIEAEHIRSIRAALSVAREARHAKILQVSSPEPGDGKSTFIANLAVAEAQAGKRVLLIDADLRRPSLQSLFRVPFGDGLAEVLRNQATLIDAMRSTPVENLTLLPAGTPPANPAEILSSPRWQRLIAEVRGQFDLILIDSPPLLAVSDPCEIARHADGLLLVMRLGKNRRPAAVRTRELIRSHNLPLLGAIANGVLDDGSSGMEYYHEYSRSEAEAPHEPETQSQLVEV
jgi:capsular exopolysaccharide synthesis family protein